MKDLGKNVSGARQELENLQVGPRVAHRVAKVRQSGQGSNVSALMVLLQMMMEVINNSKLEELMEKVEANTKDLVSAGKYQESTNTSLEVMLVILGAGRLPAHSRWMPAQHHGLGGRSAADKSGPALI